MKKKLNTIWLGLKIVFYNPRYVLLAVIAFLFMIVTLIYISVFQFLSFVLTTEIFGFWEKLSIFYSSLGNFSTNFTTSSRIIAIILSAFFAINISMLVYYLRRRIKRERASGLGFIGIIIGVIGVGCISCGSIILSTLFGFSTSILIIKYLPFKGVEFSSIGILLIMLSIYLLAKKIINSEICKINSKITS